jgi:hypothetical protein
MPELGETPRPTASARAPLGGARRSAALHAPTGLVGRGPECTLDLGHARPNPGLSCEAAGAPDRPFATSHPLLDASTSHKTRGAFAAGALSPILEGCIGKRIAFTAF